MSRFGAISHPALCLVPFHWHGMCYAHLMDMPDRAQLLGAGPKTIHSAQRGRAKGVGPSDGVDEP